MFSVYISTDRVPFRGEQSWIIFQRNLTIRNVERLVIKTRRTTEAQKNVKSYGITIDEWNIRYILFCIGCGGASAAGYQYSSTDRGYQSPTTSFPCNGDTDLSLVCSVGSRRIHVLLVVWRPRAEAIDNRFEFNGFFIDCSLQCFQRTTYCVFMPPIVGRTIVSYLSTKHFVPYACVIFLSFILFRTFPTMFRLYS